MYAGKSKYTFFLTLFSIFGIVVKKCGQALRKSAGIQQINPPDALSSTSPPSGSGIPPAPWQTAPRRIRAPPKPENTQASPQTAEEKASRPQAGLLLCEKYNFSQKNLCKNRIAHPQNRYDTGQTKKKMSLLHLLQSRKNKDLPDGKPLFCVPLIPRGMRRS